MRPTLWLKNDDGDIWDLRPRQLMTEEYSSFFATLDGTGFETKLKVARVKNDFVITEETPQQITITGTMYFRSPVNMQRFGEFVGDYTKTVRLFYDPSGKIDPRSQLDSPWYKHVRVTKLSSGEQDLKTGFWICKMVFTPLSAMWRRDTTVASSTTVAESDAHTYPFVYPYFYQNDKRLYLNILNTGERIGCKVSITNGSGYAIDQIEWTATSDNVRQYAKWLAAVGLPSGRTLVVDSNPATQKSVVQYGNDSDDVSDYQEANPQYINFVELYPGNNLIMFNLETIEGVTIEVSYTEEVRVL